MIITTRTDLENWLMDVRPDVADVGAACSRLQADDGYVDPDVELVEVIAPESGGLDEWERYCRVEFGGFDLCVVVGVPESLRGTAAAAGGDTTGPYLDTWWSNASDHDGVPEGRLEAVESALHAARRRLWALATAETACTCECGCPNQGVRLGADGLWVCAECEQTEYDEEGGFVACGRTDGVCPDCGGKVAAYGPIHTRPLGGRAYELGACGCKGWLREERGGEWSLWSPEQPEDVVDVEDMEGSR